MTETGTGAVLNIHKPLLLHLYGGGMQQGRKRERSYGYPGEYFLTIREGMDFSLQNRPNHEKYS